MAFDKNVKNTSGAGFSGPDQQQTRQEEKDAASSRDSYNNDDAGKRPSMFIDLTAGLQNARLRGISGGAVNALAVKMREVFESDPTGCAGLQVTAIDRNHQMVTVHYPVVIIYEEDENKHKLRCYIRCYTAGIAPAAISEPARIPKNGSNRDDGYITMPSFRVDGVDSTVDAIKKCRVGTVFGRKYADWKLELIGFDACSVIDSSHDFSRIQLSEIVRSMSQCDRAGGIAEWLGPRRAAGNQNSKDSQNARIRISTSLIPPVSSGSDRVHEIANGATFSSVVSISTKSRRDRYSNQYGDERDAQAHVLGIAYWSIDGEVVTIDNGRARDRDEVQKVHPIIKIHAADADGFNPMLAMIIFASWIAGTSEERKKFIIDALEAQGAIGSKSGSVMDVASLNVPSNDSRIVARQHIDANNNTVRSGCNAIARQMVAHDVINTESMPGICFTAFRADRHNAGMRKLVNAMLDPDRRDIDGLFGLVHQLLGFSITSLQGNTVQFVQPALQGHAIGTNCMVPLTVLCNLFSVAEVADAAPAALGMLSRVQGDGYDSIEEATVALTEIARLVSLNSQMEFESTGVSVAITPDAAAGLSDVLDTLKSAGIAFQQESLFASAGDYGVTSTGRNWGGSDRDRHHRGGSSSREVRPL